MLGGKERQMNEASRFYIGLSEQAELCGDYPQTTFMIKSLTCVYLYNKYAREFLVYYMSFVLNITIIYLIQCVFILQLESCSSRRK